jgi:hypothetical protein
VKPRCYFCDAELEGEQFTFKIGAREELVCKDCYTKTLNRRKAVEEESSE